MFVCLCLALPHQAVLYPRTQRDIVSDAELSRRRRPCDVEEGGEWLSFFSGCLSAGQLPSALTHYSHPDCQLLSGPVHSRAVVLLDRGYTHSAPLLEEASKKWNCLHFKVQDSRDF